MHKIIILYYSGYGHTTQIAEAVARGVQSVSEIETNIIMLPKEGKISEENWNLLDNSDTIIFGSPTYMGSCAAPLKIFMEDTSKRWHEGRWKDKLAGAFVNSGNLSGDKLNTLFQFVVFAAQHGMIWIGPHHITTTKGENDLNRIGSFVGVMTQAENQSPEVSPPLGDKLTAEKFGKRIAEITKKFNKE